MRIRIASLFLLLSLSSAINAAPIINQYAADLDDSAYTASGEYLYTANGIAGGTAKDGFNGTFWNGGNYGWQWMQADMGETRTITQLKLVTLQTPDGVSTHKVYLADSFIGANYVNLMPIFERSSYTNVGTEFEIDLDQSYSGRFLLIAVNNAASWSALGDAEGRTDWVQRPPSPSTNVPAPASFILLGLGIAGLAFKRK